MPTALSVDLRERVVATVLEGMSCPQAAARFGVSVSSVSRWAERYRSEGQVAPRPRGGDQRAEPIEQHIDLILAVCETQPGIFLRELRERLAEHGITTSTSGLSRFFKRQGITRKKGPHTRPSRSGRRKERPGRTGSTPNPTSIRTPSSSSTRPPRPPPWPGLTG